MGSESESNVMQIPAGLKKMVQSLREVVNNNCTDAEIYAVLRDCDMDPSDAVQILLSQDTFHEVKSKRERRKEMKETQESKARSNNNDSYRGVKLCSEHVGCIPSQISYNDLGKTAHRREDGLFVSSVPSSASSMYHVKTTNEQPSPHSDSSNADNSRQTMGTGDTVSSSAQPSAVTQSAWLKVTPGHVSMADIVRMGRPHNRGSEIATEISYTPQDADSQNLSHSCLKNPDDSICQPEMGQDLQFSHTCYVSKTIGESGVTASPHGFSDEWPVIEHQVAASGSSVLNASTASDIEMFPNQSYMKGDGPKMPDDCNAEVVQVSKRDVAGENCGSSCIESASQSSKQDNVSAIGGASYCNEGMGRSPHLPFANSAVPLNEEVSSAAMNLQQLNLGKESTVPPSVDDHGVVFPNSVQPITADCLHLNFGTYRSHGHTAISGPLISDPSKIYLEEASAAETDGSSAACLENRKSDYLDEYLHNKQLGPMSDTHQLTVDTGNNDMPVSSQPELIRHNIPEISCQHEYACQSSVHDSNFRRIQESSYPWSVVISPNARNLPPRHRELQAASKPIPIDLLASTVQPVRGSDRAHSSFSGTQSVPSRNSGGVSSVGNPTISMSEIHNSSAFSLPASHLSTLPGANLSTVPVLSQHLSMHSHPRPRSLEELANLTGYTSMPQSYAHNPAALQQGYQDSSVFHDSLVGMRYSLLQHKGGASRSSMPLSDADITSYGGFGSHTNFPGGYVHDLSSRPTPTTTGSAVCYDVLRSQYQERNNFSVFDQNDNPSSRTISTFPDNISFSLSGQSQLLSRYQQGQHLSQDYGALLHANAYHSQAGLMPEQQWQSLGERTVISSRGFPSKQLHHP